jgi:uracil-DNA glycosylase
MPEGFKLAIIGEAWSEEEEQWKRPFIGKAGQQLDSLLEDSGILRGECYITNVFNLRPPGSNDVSNLCTTKAAGKCAPGLSALVPGKYLKAEYGSEVDRLLAELTEVRPNLAILLGNTACWALLGSTGVGKLRGTVSLSTRLPWLKCLPTYHPAAILRQYDLRHVTVLDFLKAKREREDAALVRPEREICVAETLDDIRDYMERWLRDAAWLTFDIETANEQITCIGFASSIDRALVVPITDFRKPSGSYWSSLEEEVLVWKLVAEILALPKPEKIGQNTLYDIQYLWQKYGVPVVNYTQDTMLLHHSLQPESEKGLGFLGSVYTNEPAWKAERKKGKTIKREDD